MMRTYYSVEQVHCNYVPFYGSLGKHTGKTALKPQVQGQRIPKVMFVKEVKQLSISVLRLQALRCFLNLVEEICTYYLMINILSKSF